MCLKNLINFTVNKSDMDILNNDIPDASIIKSLCQHNKRHMQEIDRLQSLNRELEELVDELRAKLEDLEEIETIFDTLEKNTDSSDEQMTAVVRKLDYIKSIKKQSKNTQKNYHKLKKEHARLMERYVKLNLLQVEGEKGKLDGMK